MLGQPVPIGMETDNLIDVIVQLARPVGRSRPLPQLAPRRSLRCIAAPLGRSVGCRLRERFGSSSAELRQESFGFSIRNDSAKLGDHIDVVIGRLAWRFRF